MKLNALQLQIKKKELDNLLIFAGEEQGIASIYSHQIQKVLGVKAKYVDTVKEIISDLSNFTFNNQPKLYIVFNDSDLLKNEKLWEKLPTLIKDNKVILQYTNIDKRGKFYKHFTKTESSPLVMFDKLAPATLLNYAQKEIKELDKNQGKTLIELCDCDYGRMMLELDKLKHLYLASQTTKNPKSYLDIFNIALNNKIFTVKNTERVFEFVDTVLQNNKRRAFDQLEELKELRSSEILLLSLLYSGFRGILLVQSCKEYPTAENTGLTGWQIKKAKDNCGNYTVPKLVKNLRAIREIEKGIKTGLVDAEIALDYALVSCLC